MKVSTLYHSYPRWVEESGLPEQFNQVLGYGGWSLYKKFLELELEQNLLPDWFRVETGDLVRWTGIPNEELARMTQFFLDNEYLLTRGCVLPDEGLNWFKFPFPIPSALSEEEIRSRMKEKGYSPGEFLLRHLTPRDSANPVQQVVDIYQRCFGTRMNSRILSDLQEIAERFPLPMIRETFEAAEKAGTHSLNWILTRLYRGIVRESG